MTNYDKQAPEWTTNKNDNLQRQKSKFKCLHLS